MTPEPTCPAHLATWTLGRDVAEPAWVTVPAVVMDLPRTRRPRALLALWAVAQLDAAPWIDATTESIGETLTGRSPGPTALALADLHAAGLVTPGPRETWTLTKEPGLTMRMPLWFAGCELTYAAVAVYGALTLHAAWRRAIRHGWMPAESVTKGLAAKAGAAVTGLDPALRHGDPVPLDLVALAGLAGVTRFRELAAALDALQRLNALVVTATPTATLYRLLPRDGERCQPCDDAHHARHEHPADPI